MTGGEDKRGFWLDKTLAWTLAVSLLSGGAWVGSQLRDLQGQAEQTASDVRDFKAQLERQVELEREARRALSSRLSAVERVEARTDQRLIGIESGMARILEWIDRQEGRP